MTLSNIVFRNVTGSVADGAKRPPLYLIANDLTFATNVTVEDVSVWTETGDAVVNKISNVFGTGDGTYGVNDGIEPLGVGEVPTAAYTRTVTVTETPSGWVEPGLPAWAAPSTGFGSEFSFYFFSSFFFFFFF